MPILTNAWFTDRSPGFGKALIDPSGMVGTVGVSPLIAIGGSGTPPGPTSPPVLTPGVPLPDPKGPGVTIPSTSTQTLAGVGFDGTTFLHALWGTPAAPNPAKYATKLSLSCWLTFNTGISGSFTPSPDQGFLFQAAPGNLANAPAIAPKWVWVDVGGFANGGVPDHWSDFMPTGTYQMASGTATSYPTHWGHLMVSLEVKGFTPQQLDGVGNDSNYHYYARLIAYMNDTLLIDTTIYLDWLDSGEPAPGKVSGEFDFSDYNTDQGGGNWLSHAIGADKASGNYLINAAGTTAYAAGKLKCGMAEYWLSFADAVDWTVQANRYLFHNYDGAVFTPCSLGDFGQLPLGRAPAVYMTGSAADFVYNRAAGVRTASVVGALVDISDTLA